MNAPLRLTLDELLISLRRKRIPIQFEIGTFVVLEACEAVFEGPVRVSCADLSIDDEGRVSVSELAAKATAGESVRAFIDILCDLLLASAPGVPDTLLQLVEHGPTDEQYTLTRLKDDLEVALVPLNRSATRRVLARLVREAKKQSEPPVAQPQFVSSRADLDDEFDALFGRSEKASSLGSSPAIDSDQTHRSDAYKHDSDNECSVPIRFEAELRQSGAYESDQEDRIDQATARDDALRNHRRPIDQFPDHDNDFIDIREQTKEKRPVIARLGLAVIALIILAVGYFVLADHDEANSRSSTALEGITANNPLKPKTTKGTAPADKTSPSSGILTVNSTPSLAQVLLYIGHGLARVEGVPLGVEHEFVAIAEGFSPSRKVLAADAKWRIEEGVQFTNLTITLAPLKVQRSAAGLGSTRLPLQHAVPSGQFGTVEIRTQPSEAAIYQLVGFTPDLTIEIPSANRPIRLLVYAAGYRAKHIDIDPSRWIEREGRLSAEVDARLKPI